MKIALPDGQVADEIVDDSGIVRVVFDKKRPADVLPDPAPYDSPFPLYYPHTRRHPRTVGASPRNAIWVDVSASNFAYFAAATGWWARGETFAIIEHDVICRPDVLEEFENCPEPWCCFGYADMCCQDETGWSPCMEAWRNELGCTRFRKEIIEAVPDALSSLPQHLGDVDVWDWHNMCDGLGHSLRKAGFTHHWHVPPVEHHHGVDGIHGPQQLKESNV